MAELFWSRLERDVVLAEGPGAGAYLQGQLSQDVLALADGGCAWSWILAPNGKVDALVRVWRVSGERWMLDTDAGWGAAVAERLERFKLRTEMELALDGGASVSALRGSGWEQAAGGSGAQLVSSPAWPGGEGADLLSLEGSQASFADWPEVCAAEYEAYRVEAGELRMGAELTDKTIPAETGLVAATVSFTKGCYTGQELVARIDSRGSHVPRQLWRLRFSDGPVAPGIALTGPGGETAGEVTSAAGRVSAGNDAGSWVGLGYLKRAVDPDGPLDAAGVGVSLLPMTW